MLGGKCECVGAGQCIVGIHVASKGGSIVLDHGLEAESSFELE